MINLKKKWTEQERSIQRPNAQSSYRHLHLQPGKGFARPPSLLMYYLKPAPLIMAAAIRDY
ncbi:MAG: hypothetical protein ACUVR0_09290 [Candidatus Aminicenantales bacterium]